MPNGGSDCCMTCWFNRSNRGKRGYRHRDRSIPPSCEIRDLEIEDPAYTYCANHPHRRPDRDPVPIGPVLRHGGWGDRGEHHPRYVWRPSPDSEEIRRHLLALLGSLFEQMSRDTYPLGIGLGETIVWQLGEFRERRALKDLTWIRDHDPLGLGEAASEALRKIAVDP